VTAREHDSRGPDGGINVELSIDDVELVERVREMLMHDPGIHIISGDGLPADIRITDGTTDAGSGAPVLVFCTGAEALEALQAGASAALPEDTEGDALRSAVRAVAGGLIVLTEGLRDLWLAHSDLDELAHAEEDDSTATELTERELQVLALLAEGASNKSIARSLAITPHTAKFHVASIVAKLGATGRTEAVARAIRLGVLMI
jgi:DNA-binding NarL/FixJ family response regulator